VKYHFLYILFWSLASCNPSVPGNQIGVNKSFYLDDSLITILKHELVLHNWIESNNSISVKLDSLNKQYFITITGNRNDQKFQSSFLFNQEENVIIDTAEKKEILLSSGISEKDREDLKKAASEF
jgi:hypothetical protein